MYFKKNDVLYNNDVLLKNALKLLLVNFIVSVVSRCRKSMTTKTPDAFPAFRFGLNLFLGKPKN